MTGLCQRSNPACVICLCNVINWLICPLTVFHVGHSSQKHKVAEFVCWCLVHEVDLPQSPSITHSLLLCRGVHPVCPEHRRHGRGVVDQVRHGWWRRTCICGTLTADYNVSHYCRNNSNYTSFSLLQSITFKFYSKNNQ